MRFLLSTLLVVGCVNAQSIQAQDGPWQRFTNLLTKGRFDSVKSEPRTPSADVQRATPTGAFETRGVVYVEEMRGPGTPPKVVMAPPPPTLPQPTPVAVRPQPAPQPTPVAVRPQSAPPPVSPIRQVSATKDESLAQRLTRQVSQACPQGRNVKVTFQSEKEITVEMEARTMEQANAFAEHIFAIRALDPYRINLKFNVPQS